MKFNHIAAQQLLALSFATFAFSATAMDKVTLKLAHNLDTSHIVHQTWVQMAKDLSAESGGKMKLRIYPGGQMGGPRETLELLQNGALDMTKAMANELEAFTPAYSVYSLPYLFKNDAHFNAVVHGPVGDAMTEATKEKGFFPVAAYVGGTRSFYAKKPIHSPADMKGMKFRVIVTPTTIRFIELLGASPVSIPLGEVYTALQQGVIDGAENNEPSYVQTRHEEVAKYYTENQHTAMPDYLVIANKTWDRLSDEQKAVLEKVLKKSEATQAKAWDLMVAESVKEAEKDGATFITVDKEPFRQALQPLYDDFKKDPVRGPWITKIESAGEGIAQ
ncbi:TRAP transporter substrate-binding protein [Pantoea sp. FN060301]|uniref:TRAP transporter substrate-binding protein n=1 Tax=Pantoea sp. FN060301 TaxID=3420380 RepID=UPI003D172632